MKRLPLYIIGLISIISCNTDDNSLSTELADSERLIGTWHLIEELSDPGDGSGTFQPVESDLNLVFEPDQTVWSNLPFCPNSITGPLRQIGSYDLDSKTILFDQCPLLHPSNVEFDFVDTHLILYDICIEACASKFEKVD